MDRLELVRLALQELGDVPARELSAFIEKKRGVKIDPKFIPVFRATLRDRTRQSVRPVVKQIAVEPRAAAPRGALSERASRAQQMAVQLMADHGLHRWQFRFNRCKRAMGLCVFHRRRIELSIHFVERDNPIAEIRDTILHEIAHALVGPGHGHDEVWKRKCVEVGARPSRCGNADMPEGKWKARCGACGRKFHRHRRPQQSDGWFCPECGPVRGKLVWKEVTAAA
jgi:predicted SprT family Zn-dependent metalloprotease